MSLDVYLTTKRDEPTPADKAIALLRANDLEEMAWEIEARHEHGDIVLYTANYTHNCNHMAEAAGIYEHLWHPDRIGITKAGQLIVPLTVGLELMRSDPERFKKFNPSNGWGSYDTFVPWIARYLDACTEHPDADVHTCT